MVCLKNENFQMLGQANPVGSSEVWNECDSAKSHRTLYDPVLAALGTKFDDLLPYRTGWRHVEEHILYWTCTASWDHKLPVARGGSSTDLGNIITSCYQCNDVRGDYLYAEIGWVARQPQPSPWRGLSEYLESLYSSLGLSLVRRPVPGMPLVEPVRRGMLIRATLPNKGKDYRSTFRVDAIDVPDLELSEMWRRGPAKLWHVGRSLRRRIEELSHIELLRERAPEEDDPDD